ncbi:hypothetical protein QQ045_021043 [Rhodiola kirilowii]
MEPDDIIHPGPIDGSVLTRQTKHRTHEIWNHSNDPKMYEPLTVKHVTMEPPDARIRQYVANAGFYPWSIVANVKTDPGLITALVERWRPETHTFHFNGGEATITLQDVALLTGLPIEGRPVTGHAHLTWPPICMRLLGDIPTCHKGSPGLAKKVWFKENMSIIPADADEETLKRYARAYILQLLGLTLFSELSGSSVPLHFLPLLDDLDSVRHYSWGSAALAYLYHMMCKASKSGKCQIGGAVLILQFWSWERMRFGRPKCAFRYLPLHDADIDPLERGAWTFMKWHGPKNFIGVPKGSLLFYRDEFQKMLISDFIWRPYDEGLYHLLNPICVEGRHSWTANVPLIHFNVIEWHHPGRVMRQFGFRQFVPLPPIACSNENHGKNRKPKVDWGIQYHRYIQMWSDRLQYIVDGEASDSDIASPEYYSWYSMITRRLIQPRIEEEADDAVVAEDAVEAEVNPPEQRVRTLVYCAREAANAIRYCFEPHTRASLHTIFHQAYETLDSNGEAGVVGEAVVTDEDDDANANIDSYTDDRDRPSSSSQPQTEDPWYPYRSSRLLPRRGSRPRPEPQFSALRALRKGDARRF